jgi:predicted peroxiredoxin
MTCKVCDNPWNKSLSPFLNGVDFKPREATREVIHQGEKMIVCEKCYKVINLSNKRNK